MSIAIEIESNRTQQKRDRGGFFFYFTFFIEKTRFQKSPPCKDRGEGNRVSDKTVTTAEN